jgi:VacB/RNase II family 3'-5' exoribonuclease
MQKNHQNHRAILNNIAHNAMLGHGFLPDFSSEVIAELAQYREKENIVIGNGIRNLRNLLWASIDNDDSLDIDQLTTAESISGNKVKILVAIADVAARVKKGSAIDEHARHNTTSVYTPARVFSMLPEKLSTDLTSLNFNEERISIVVEMVIDPDGTVSSSNIFKAMVNNHAKLAYNSVAAWLQGRADIPKEIAEVPGLAENLRLQDQAAQRMKKLRHLNGALSLQTIQSRPVFEGDQIEALDPDEPNRAKEIIEDFMIGANGATARFLSTSGFPSIRRVVRTPKRWERIVEIAADNNYDLPDYPDSKALEAFLVRQRTADPIRFPDLSLAVIKLMGSGEYIAEEPGGNAPGHFGLAVKNYSHSTAPNRRFPDLITQRLIIAALEEKPVPYNKKELELLATHCTRAEDEAKKVERQVEKSAAALLLESRIGEKFDAIVTGASEKGTWVRLFTIPIEGKLVQGSKGLDVGHRLRVKLIDVNVERGYIDFKKIGSNK